MAIQVSSKLIPKGGEAFALMDESHISGGYRTLDFVADLDVLDASVLKIGMLVHVQETGLYYRLNESFGWVVALNMESLPDMTEDPVALFESALADVPEYDH